MMTRSIIILSIVLGIAINLNAQQANITYLDPDNFYIQYQSEVFAILADVSLKREFRRARIPGAVSIPKMKNLYAFADTLDREIPIYIYCDGESRSRTVAEYLQAKEFHKLIILQGGFTYWEAAGLPIEKKRKK